MRTLAAASAVVALLLPPGASRPAAAASPGEVADGEGTACLLAVVGDAAVGDADADALRALLTPPPDREAARRLAVDAALAHFWLRGYVAAASARGRLEAWRSLLEALRPDARDEVEAGAIAQAVLLRLAARSGLVAGPCLQAIRGDSAVGAAPGRPTVPEAASGPASAQAPEPHAAAARLLRRAGAREPLVRLRLDEAWASSGACDAGLTKANPRSIDLGLVPLGHLDPDIARIAASLPAGGASGPIATRSGVVSVSVLDRIDSARSR